MVHSWAKYELVLVRPCYNRPTVLDMALKDKFVSIALSVSTHYTKQTKTYDIMSIVELLADASYLTAVYGTIINETSRFFLEVELNPVV